MKTTLPDGTVRHVYEDSDLDDEIIPRGKPLLSHLIVCVLIALFLVFGLIGLLCI